MLNRVAFRCFYFPAGNWRRRWHQRKNRTKTSGTPTGCCCCLSVAPKGCLKCESIKLKTLKFICLYVICDQIRTGEIFNVEVTVTNGLCQYHGA